MAAVKEHYENLLSDVYSWMLGGFDKGIEKNFTFFAKHQISPVQSATAVDLGSGCGFQSIPLARIGFSVISIDIDKKLLDELKKNSAALDINIINDDLLNFEKFIADKAGLIVCMNDTILHLDSRETVISLFNKAAACLDKGGKFIITFRDFSTELYEADRFIPVRSDDRIILTCFLEYEPEAVKVYDLVYKRKNGEWGLKKSFYRKLRLSNDWVKSRLSASGFKEINLSEENGMTTVIAVK